MPSTASGKKKYRLEFGGSGKAFGGDFQPALRTAESGLTGGRLTSERTLAMGFYTV